ncbi:site-specific integrase [Rickettsiales bacterium]|nr:site-specific integrase [Rickettsiales bacterium]
MAEIDTRYNEANEIVKYKFLEQLEHSKDGKDPKTVDQYARGIHEFEVATGFKDFKKFNHEWAIIFKEHLNDKKNKRTGKHISKSLYFHYIAFVREFFQWLAKNNKDYAKIKEDDINYLYVTRNDKNKARATNYQESHDVADILSTIRKMPSDTEVEMRNQAMVSLCLLTTPRISSLQTATIKSIKYFKDYDIWSFIQDPRTQNTKNSKKITAVFIGQSEDIIQNVLKWRDCLIAQGFTDNEPLFPKIASSLTVEGDPIQLLTRDFIQSQSQIRGAIKTAFVNNDLPYRNPHSFRHSIARKMKLGENATARLIALAENYGHKGGMSTLVASYGGDYLKEQAEILKGFGLE